ncbi:NAD(P)H-dependent oxidoreductase [Myroides marinus]|uniref:Putative NADPH-quinone reductase (Modulator of drug activity B) n=1 Tax=Myroides marinus TaxID=703342 RepID=A0A1H6UXM9_9FLAO|nr:NAD(P)H-dependent oxidoreductase [Myroides marinus]MDM1346070.1 NAD(P)H-dependent oxidoreductase [Myroides marinus]MDM1350878.1 NAD(P)H-dependent oxidoreductase [Myroides marinus]MDM1353324.1 NAD(P)H-dependent oxidoreductase [Myroides marinus]MDM1358085.1 NAD(P)H-dependent oxidoreductase [Myroides marinus]MDM1375507.1 NAD(P)H-dependent oxidoreductase [Myroides marinus]
MKKITIINGHPNKEAFNFGVVEAYVKGAIFSGAEIRHITLAEMEFDANLKYGYQKRMNLEPDLLRAIDDIKWADHLVWVHPVWWGGAPALLKGFIDRVFLPGIMYRYRENSMLWDKLLKGKTAHIITTLDQPGWYYRMMYGRPSVNQLKKSTLQFCGVSPVKVTYIGIVRNSKESQRAKWLTKVHRLGVALK